MITLFAIEPKNPSNGCVQEKKTSGIASQKPRAKQVKHYPTPAHYENMKSSPFERKRTDEFDEWHNESAIA